MRIVGVMLIKNEDVYIEKVIGNVIDFCDQLIILENYSTDGTFNIISSLSLRDNKIKIIRVEDPYDTHKYVESYAGTPTWVFRIDGDELYDREGLLNFRTVLLSGFYDRWLAISCPCFNVVNLDLVNKKATGYLGEASCLVNFSLLKSWHEGKNERLHGTNKSYSDDYKPQMRKNAEMLKLGFEKSQLRYLHLCFIKRSSRDVSGGGRLNPGEKKSIFSLTITFFRNLLVGTFGLSSYYKNKTYRKGERLIIDTSNFL